MSDRPLLRQVAEQVGILPGYWRCDGRGYQETSDRTREGLLVAMGMDAATEAGAAAVLRSLGEAHRSRVFDAVQATSDPSSLVFRLRHHIAESSAVWIDGRIEIRNEAGAVRVIDGRWPLEMAGQRLQFTVPYQAAIGYHDIRAHLTLDGQSLEADQFLIVSPVRCHSLFEKSGRTRVFGLWTNLYTVRREGHDGIGDLASLSELVDWAGEVGASFVGINPLHALRGAGSDVCPYRAVSRLFHNPAYLTPEATPEWGLITAPGRPTLRNLHRTFAQVHHRDQTDRGKRYAAYVRDSGIALTDFATFCALDEHWRNALGVGDWRSWPVEYRDVHSQAVAEYRRTHAEDVDFHGYVQFELDRQLSTIAERAGHLGLPVGLFHDLALGAAPDGADPWMNPGLFLDAVSLGAPPDELAPEGQDWAIPPMNPVRLRDTRYDFWIRVLRSSFAHAGALRIDHVMGLLRQFWIPEGAPGAYVRFPADELLAILAVESHRARAIVVGEDLGTVPEGFADLMERWGLLSTKVLYFEKDGANRFRAPQDWPARALATVHTHDLPPFVGFWNGRDIELRAKVGQLPDAAKIADATQTREADKAALSERFQAEGLLQPDQNPGLADRVAAAYGLLSRTPAQLVGVSLDDLALETEPVNVPGAGPDQHPSWTRKMSKSLSELRESPEAAGILHQLRDRSFRPHAPHA